MNVTLVIGDSLRYDFVGCYGERDDTRTPNIDSIALKSYVFTNCYTLAPGTLQAVTYMLTGDWSAGGHGLQRTTPHSKYLDEIQGKGLITGMEPVARWAVQFDVFRMLHGWDIEKFYNAYTIMLGENLDMSFIYIHSFFPHHPYRQINHSPLIAAEKIGAVAHKDFILDMEAFNAVLPPIIDMYNEGIAEFDRLVGMLFEHDPKRVFIIAADHGECFGELQWFGHNKIHDVTMHIPLIIYVPDNMMGHVIAANVDISQIIKTVVEFVTGKPTENSLCQFLPLLTLNGNTVPQLKNLGYI